jgi:hypothetical protein
VIFELLIGASIAASSTAQPDLRVVEDVRGVREFRYVIDPATPPFVFQFVGDAENSPREIRCLRPGEATPFQVLDLLQDAAESCGDIESPYRGSLFFSAEDFDGDGFNDLRVLAFWGTGGETFFYYLWVPARSEFALGTAPGDFGPRRPGCIDGSPNPSLQRTTTGRSPGGCR